MPSINFKDIALKIVPSYRRKPKMMDFIYSLIKPIDNTNVVFSAFTSDTDYYLKFNGQIIYLEHILNDLYDNISRGIYIEDLANVDKIYLRNRVEARPPFYLYNRAEAQPPKYFKNLTEYTSNNRFIVKVPNTVTYVELEMRAIIDKYKQAGVNYTIEVI